jgi:hypothetical protein
MSAKERRAIRTAERKKAVEQKRAAAVHVRNSTSSLV